MGVRNGPVYVNPLPREYYDTLDRFRREVLDRASEMPRDELERLMAAHRKWERPYAEMENRAMREYLLALVGMGPEDLKEPAEFDGCLSKYFGPDCDSLEMIRSVRGRGS